MKRDDFSRCSDGPDAQSLAGYKYVTDRGIVNSAAHIDVDISKVNMFIGNGARHFPGSEETLFQTAFDIYKYGRHSNEIGLLGNMARDPNRDVVPMFGAFRRYFNTDKHYVDTIVVRAHWCVALLLSSMCVHSRLVDLSCSQENAFLKKGNFELASFDQRRRAIAFSLKYMLTYMAILEKLYSAIQSCQENKSDDGAQNIDVAAGYLIGSLEGPEDGGSYDGDIIFMLAKRMCVHFGTCTLSGNARVCQNLFLWFGIMFPCSSLWCLTLSQHNHADK